MALNLSKQDGCWSIQISAFFNQSIETSIMFMCSDKATVISFGVKKSIFNELYCPAFDY